MIVAYSGRRAASLPEGVEPQLAVRLCRLITALGPTSLVGSGADGSDMLILEAALDMKPPATLHVVLPTPRSEFRNSSVEASWRGRHDRLLERIERAGSVETLDLAAGDDAYRAANARILDRATELAGADGSVVALVVAGRGEGRMVEDFAERARLGGLPVLRVDPAVDIADRPRPRCTRTS